MSLLRDETQAFVKKFASQIPSTKPLDVCDVGTAGDPEGGGNATLFKDHNYRTMDVNPTLNPSFVEDIRKTSLPPAMFDIILLIHILEHVFEYQQALDETYRLLRPDGVALIVVPWLYQYHPEEGFDDYWRFSATALDKLLRATGFTKVDAIQGFFGTFMVAFK